MVGKYRAEFSAIISLSALCFFVDWCLLFFFNITCLACLFDFKKNSNDQTHQSVVVELCIGNSGLLTPLYGITNSPFCSLGLAIVLSNQLDQLSK